MKKFAISGLLIFSTSIALCQKNIPSFGKIDKEDLEMKECDIDKDAEAYKLISTGSVHYEVGGDHFNIITETRTRIKILKDKGLSQANIKRQIYSSSNYEKMYDISGVTYNLDDAGKIVTAKLEKSSIYNKPLTNKVSEISFTMPNVKVGSVIEFKYKVARQGISSVDDWYFQDDIPTRYSSYSVMIPALFNFVSQTLAYQQVDYKTEDVYDPINYKGGLLSNRSEVRTYALANVAALRPEPFMRAERDYLQRVVSQLNRIVYPDGSIEKVRNTWESLTTDLLNDEDFGIQLKKNLPHTKELDDQLKAVSGDYQKMSDVFYFVRQNMNWNGVETKYSSQGLKTAWDKKSGSSGEINLILVNLLRDAGLKAYPMLVSTHDHGAVSSMYPFLDQFNETIACVMIGDKNYYLNAADKYNPVYLTPYDVLDNDAFIVDGTHGGWVNLSNTNREWKNVVYYNATISDDAEMSGNAQILNYDYAKNPRVKNFTEDRKAFDDYFTKAFTAMKVSNIDVKNEHVDSMPLQQRLDFTLPLNSSGDYKYFTLNLFQDLDKNPFIADDRKTDIDFNFPQSYTLSGRVVIPADYEFDELPKNIRMIMPDTSITLQRIVQKDGKVIQFLYNIDFKKSFYSAAAYPIVQEFFKKMFSTLEEQIVIKKIKSA